MARRNLFPVLSVAVWLASSRGALGQCSDSTTVHYAIHHLTREASNSVDSLAGTQTVGDYWEYWASYVQSNEAVNSTPINSSSQQVGDGQVASLEWHNAPSSSGTGLYTTSNTHVATSECGDYTSYGSSDSLPVQPPTITGASGAWFLGGGSDPNNGYYNQAALTANSNCGPSDTCNDTPVWTVTQTGSKVSLNCSVCYDQTITAEAPSNAQGDVTFTISIGGLTSSPFAFTVNSPGSLDSAGPPYDIPYEDGWFTALYYNTLDEFGNRMPSVALNEEFSTPANCPGGAVSYFCPDQSNNWQKPSAYGLAGYNQQGYWYDQIYVYGWSGWAPAYSGPQKPLSSSTVDHSVQTWRVGSATVGQGVEVQYDTFQRYVDHGRHNGVVSPVQ